MYFSQLIKQLTILAVLCQRHVGVFPTIPLLLPCGMRSPVYCGINLCVAMLHAQILSQDMSKRVQLNMLGMYLCCLSKIVMQMVCSLYAEHYYVNCLQIGQLSTMT